MEWIVTIENEPKQRIRINFNSIGESILVQGEYKTKGKWEVFSFISHDMTVNLEQLQLIMSDVVDIMRRRIIEYENLNKGFSVLKTVAYNEEEEMD